MERPGLVSRFLLCVVEPEQRHVCGPSRGSERIPRGNGIREAVAVGDANKNHDVIARVVGCAEERATKGAGQSTTASRVSKRCPNSGTHVLFS